MIERCIKRVVWNDLNPSVKNVVGYGERERARHRVFRSREHGSASRQFITDRNAIFRNESATVKRPEISRTSSIVLAARRMGIFNISLLQIMRAVSSTNAFLRKEDITMKFIYIYIYNKS